MEEKNAHNTGLDYNPLSFVFETVPDDENRGAPFLFWTNTKHSQTVWSKQTGLMLAVYQIKTGVIDW
jgi:hypothetical protein